MNRICVYGIDTEIMSTLCNKKQIWIDTYTHGS